MDISKPIQIAESLWWVGSNTLGTSLRCNPYLYLHGSTAILFEPGSVLDFDVVREKVESLVPIKELDAIVCSHQDPDLCSSLPLFERSGFKRPICCHSRSASIITFYGVKLPFYLVDHHEYAFPLVDGTQIKFLFAPYLHFPGAIMSYLSRPKALISGDLFGAFGQADELYAGERYEQNMRSYHEAYMPSHEILKPVMDQLNPLEIDLICPQHGAIIRDRIPYYINVLRQLQCGIFLNPVKKKLLEAGGIRFLCNKVIDRYVALFGPVEVRKALSRSPFTYDARHRTITSCSLPEPEQWEAFFTLIHDREGMSWITVVAPLVELLGKEYSITLPGVFRTVVFNAMQEQQRKETRLQIMEEEKAGLEQRLDQMEEDRKTDPVTGLYNQEFHRVFIKEEMERVARHDHNVSFILMSIDNLANINLDFGSEEGDATIRQLATIIRQRIEPSSRAFRLAGGTIGLYCTHFEKDEIIQRVNVLLAFIAESESFIVPVTVSIGMFHSSEIPASVFGDIDQMADVTTQTTRYRLKLAQKRGGGLLVFESATSGGSNTVFTILLIDEPGLGRNLIKRALEQNHYRVTVADNGLEGRRSIEREVPDIIISELMIAKVSALTLRKELLAKPSTRKIPFLLMSYNKNESTIGRAVDAKISHFFPRPVMIVELLGVVSLIANRLQIQGD